MSHTYSFGEWLKQRRKAQRLSQRELAAHAACAVSTIKKIEADERRPSPEVALLLAGALGVPEDWRDTFVACARGQRPVDALAKMRAAQADSGGVSVPTFSTPFIGRDTELEEIERLLAQPDCRLLTLVGAGGVGKTRLALETARRQLDVLEDGVVFIPLAAVSEAAVIPTTVIHSLNLSLASEEHLFAFLRNQKMLLVLDNCEQLGDGVAWFSTLLSHAPSIKLLATSRERLQLSGEWVYHVSEMSQDQAITLLQRSGQRVAHGLDLSGQNAGALCDVVDNLPLAIELAAGWLSFMTCDQIATSIQRDIDFLASNARDVPERHRSIRAVFDYSWKLLSEQEQNTLMRLSVFRGGWTLDESASVADTNLSLLRTLMDKSLVHSAGNERYDMHELTRQHAAEKLRESGREVETRERHAEAYTKLADDTQFQMQGQAIHLAFERTEAEMDNYRAVLRWTIDTGREETAQRLLTLLFWPWQRLGFWQEGERWYREALAATGDEETTWVCQGLVGLSTFIAIQGRYVEALPLSDKAVAMSTRLDDPMAKMAVAWQNMQRASSLEDARKWFETDVSLLLQWDHPLRDIRLAGAYTMLGDRLRDAGYDTEAATYFRMAVNLFGDKSDMRAYPLGNLGRLALQDGRLEEAYDLISKSVSICRQSGNRVGIADWIQRQGEILLHMGDLSQAEACFEEALALYEEIGNSRAVPDMAAFLAHTALLQEKWELAADRLRASLADYKRLLYDNRSLVVDRSNKFTTPVINTLFGAAIVSAQRESDDCAAILLGKSILLRRANSEIPEPALQAKVNEVTTQLRNRLGDDRFDTMLEQGGSLSIGDALDYALECL